MKIAENVHKIECGCNVYLILDSETIIDTGFYGEKEKLKEEIEKIIPLDKIKKVILTHLHYDHCDNLDLFPNAEFYASREEIDDFKKNPYNFFFDKVPDEIKKIIFNKFNEIPDRISGLNVLNVPGHTRGSIALVDENKKILFSGDTLFRDGIGRYDFANSVPEKIMESVQMLTNLLKKESLTLCAGHDY